MVNDILSDIKDSVLLTELKTEDPAYDLYQEYLLVADSYEKSVKLTDTATGADLKAAIDSLPSKEKLRLLHLYAESDKVETETKHTSTKDSVVEKVWNDTYLRRFIIKTLIGTVVFLIIISIGAALAVAFMTGKISDGVIINSIMDTAIEIVKMMFGF